MTCNSLKYYVSLGQGLCFQNKLDTRIENFLSSKNTNKSVCTATHSPFYFHTAWKYLVWGGGGGVEVLRILGYRKSDGCLISVWGFQILPGVLRIELRFELILFKDFSW